MYGSTAAMSPLEGVIMTGADPSAGVGASMSGSGRQHRRGRDGSSSTMDSSQASPPINAYPDRHAPPPSVSPSNVRGRKRGGTNESADGGREFRFVMPVPIQTLPE